MKNKKFRLSHKILIALLSVVMLASTATSFAFWFSDIEDAKKSVDLGVVIGTGSTVQASLDLGKHQDNNDDQLVPYDLVPAYTPIGNEVTEIYFAVPIRWVPNANNDITTTGTLDVELKSVLAVNSSTQLMAETGKNGNALFEVVIAYGSAATASASDFASGADDVSFGGTSTKASIPLFFDVSEQVQNVSIYVYVRIRLSEPKNQDQYNLIANNKISSDFAFTMTVSDI